MDGDNSQNGSGTPPPVPRMQRPSQLFEDRNGWFAKVHDITWMGQPIAAMQMTIEYIAQEWQVSQDLLKATPAAVAAAVKAAIEATHTKEYARLRQFFFEPVPQLNMHLGVLGELKARESEFGQRNATYRTLIDEHLNANAQLFSGLKAVFADEKAQLLAALAGRESDCEIRLAEVARREAEAARREMAAREREVAARELETKANDARSRLIDDYAGLVSARADVTAFKKLGFWGKIAAAFAGQYRR